MKYTKLHLLQLSLELRLSVPLEQTAVQRSVEVHPKMSPISDDRGDKRKFATGPSRNSAKHVPGRDPELEKTPGAMYQQQSGVF